MDTKAWESSKLDLPTDDFTISYVTKHLLIKFAG
jgi:hypothetical protein